LRVPEDISVVGFDDIQMAEFTEPPLTTVRLLRTQVARLACDALLQSIRTHGAGVEFHMGTALVVRCSTAKALQPRDPCPSEAEISMADK
jgi:LacI family transcriptional regulator